MNAIADALGMGKLPTPVLYVVIGLVSGGTASVWVIRLPSIFEASRAVSLCCARSSYRSSFRVGVGFPRLYV